MDGNPMYKIMTKKLAIISLLGMVASLSGCTLQPMTTQPVMETPTQTTSVGPACANCFEESISSECAKSVAVVTYQDPCHVCGNLPVSVRAYSQSQSCR